jgi:hypothetical protein
MVATVRLIRHYKTFFLTLSKNLYDNIAFTIDNHRTPFVVIILCPTKSELAA